MSHRNTGRGMALLVWLMLILTIWGVGAALRQIAGRLDRLERLHPDSTQVENK